MEKTDWLDIESPAKVSPPAAAPPAADDDDWLNIEDPNAGKTSQPFRALVDQCMRGTDRVMACDGRYMAYRPMNRAFDKETNPRTKERVAMFLADGKWKHLGTYDEVQVYELLEGNPYRHTAQNYVIGQDYWKDIKKAAAAAIHRAWADYHDILQAMAIALKSGRDPAFARVMWGDTINHVAVAIRQAGPDAPSEKEVNEGFMGIRRARGIAKGGELVTLNSDALQKVGF